MAQKLCSENKRQAATECLQNKVGASKTTSHVVKPLKSLAGIV